MTMSQLLTPLAWIGFATCLAALAGDWLIGTTVGTGLVVLAFSLGALNDIAKKNNP